ncbi:leucine carboxyl methyltransferase [Polychaeton citri CBS 116435]|uniref:Leucine carboxyl methyltransferase 1 n=1 Tax=Polychaeton citri CBS 116435 TaxID=1314669 RepID=A0A9P4QDN9_9PEZI|nr:leucine carboxyl methyltransferase [Polychaeton citri CBS 116435]
MASIPNLNTLRRGGQRRRGGRGGRAVPENDDTSNLENSENEKNDRIIQQTDYDASSSRVSAVALGYLDDPYAQLFLQPGEQIAKRYPMHNRGSYVRTTAIDRFVTSFIRHPSMEGGDAKRQIISLGAGSDTRFWRLCRGDHGRRTDVVYHELDFEKNVEQKRQAIERAPELESQLEPTAEMPSTYFLHALDLRTLARSPTEHKITGLNPSLPTLLLSECCLCYVPPDTATSIIKYFTNIINGPVAVILYEPIRPYDPFGRTMVANLGSRGIQLQTLRRFHSLEAQRKRLQMAGFDDKQGARDIHQIWTDNDWISEAERERVEKLEWLDEVEEWELIGSHYCVTWGWKGDVFSGAWEGIEGGRTGSEARDDEFG